MSDRIDDTWFDHAMRDVDVTAPAELRSEIRRLVRGGVLALDLASPEHRRRRWLVPTVAAALVAVLVGFVVVGAREADPMIGPADTEGSVTETTLASTTSAATTTMEVSAPAVGDVTADAASGTLATTIDDLLTEMGLAPGTILTGSDATNALTVLDRHRLGLFRRSPGFAATSTFGSTWVLTDGSKPRPDAPPTHVDVTVLASADVWAEFDNGDWYHFDAAAGIGRGVYRNAVTGSPDALQTQGAPNRHDYGSLFGHDPLARLDSLPSRFRELETAEIEVALDPVGGQRTVRVRVETDRLGEEQFLVDLASGLIVGYDAVRPDENGTLGLYSSIAEVTVADELPIDAAPALPAGVEWQVLSDITVPVTTSIEDAVAAFGPGLVLPRAALASGTVAMEHNATTAGGMVVAVDHPAAAVRNVRVEVAMADGLLRSMFHISTAQPTNEGVVPDGYELRDGRLCMLPCDTTPTAGEATATPRTGALAGTGLFGEGSQLVANDAGIHIAIEASTAEEALEIAESLVAVGADGSSIDDDAAEGREPIRSHDDQALVFDVDGVEVITRTETGRLPERAATSTVNGLVISDGNASTMFCPAMIALDVVSPPTCRGIPITPIDTADFGWVDGDVRWEWATLRVRLPDGAAQSVTPGDEPVIVTDQPATVTDAWVGADLPPWREPHDDPWFYWPQWPEACGAPPTSRNEEVIAYVDGLDDPNVDVRSVDPPANFPIVEVTGDGDWYRERFAADGVDACIVEVLRSQDDLEALIDGVRPDGTWTNPWNPGTFGRIDVRVLVADVETVRRIAALVEDPTVLRVIGESIVS